MKHKLEQLQNLVHQISMRSADRLKKKPIVSIEVQRHDEVPEEHMLQDKMDSSLDPSHEEGELALSNDKDGRKAMMKRFGK